MYILINLHLNDSTIDVRIDKKLMKVYCTQNSRFVLSMLFYQIRVGSKVSNEKVTKNKIEHSLITILLKTIFH